MAYSDFSLETLQQEFGIALIEDQRLFPNTPPLAIPPPLANQLERFLLLALNVNTEKARSEFIIAPVLAELKWMHRDRISLFSGIEFNVNEARGLKGRCDYLISLSREQLVIQAPVLLLVEAKNENMIAGIPQCLAEMIAAREFNQAKGNHVPIIYGVVTTGNLWRFLKLADNAAAVDTVEYPIHELDLILGALQSCVLA